MWGPAELEAVEIAALIRTGSGGLDWNSLPFIVQWLGVRDVDMLCHRLRVILLHKPDNPNPES